MQLACVASVSDFWLVRSINGSSWYSLGSFSLVWWVRGYSINSRLALNIIWISVLYILRKERNSRIFKHKVDTLQSLIEKVKLRTFWWLKSYLSCSILITPHSG